MLLRRCCLVPAGKWNAQQWHAGVPGSATAPVISTRERPTSATNFSEIDTVARLLCVSADLRKKPPRHQYPGFGDTRAGHRQVFTVNETHVFSPNIVNEARLGANRILITFNTNAPIDPASVGLLGPTSLWGCRPLPFADIGLVFGSERAFPQGRGDTTFVPADSVS